MNEQDLMEVVSQAVEKRVAEAHAEGRREAVAEIRDRLIGFVARLKEAAQTQLEAVNLMETLLMDKPATPAKRKRASKEEIQQRTDTIRGMLSQLRKDQSISVKQVAHILGFEPPFVARVCLELEKQGWIKRAGDDWQWISEREAEEMNGPVMVDDIKEQGNV